jgi:hypothetical protein
MTTYEKDLEVRARQAVERLRDIPRRGEMRSAEDLIKLDKEISTSRAIATYFAVIGILFAAEIARRWFLR